MLQNSFSKRAEAFVRSVVKQRSFLIKSGRSKKPEAEQLGIINFIIKHLDAYPDRTDKQMAGFWNKNADQFFTLLPGKGSAVHETLTETFYQLNSEAKTLIVVNLVKPQIPIHY